MNRQPLPDLEGVKETINKWPDMALKNFYDNYEEREKIIEETIKDFTLPWYDVARIREEIAFAVADEAAQRFFGRMGK